MFSRCWEYGDRTQPPPSQTGGNKQDKTNLLHQSYSDMGQQNKTLQRDGGGVLPIEGTTRILRRPGLRKWGWAPEQPGGVPSGALEGIVGSGPRCEWGALGQLCCKCDPSLPEATVSSQPRQGKSCRSRKAHLGLLFLKKPRVHCPEGSP